MPNEDVAYPTEDMISVSHDLRPFIESQWQQHTSLFMNNPDSFSTLLKNIAQLIPNGAGKANELVHALEGYHRQYQEAYTSLRTLAEQIEKAAQAMKLTDQSISTTFHDTRTTPQ